MPTCKRAQFRSPLRPLVIAISLAFAILSIVPGVAGAVKPYTDKTDEPCISCHTNSSSGALNPKGAAFAAIGTHQADPVAAWAQVSAASPTRVQSGAAAEATAAVERPVTTPGQPSATPFVLLLIGVGSIALVVWLGVRKRPR